MVKIDQKLTVSRLLSGIKSLTVFCNDKDPIIKGISSNSKEIKPGYIFAAIRGEKHNGEDYIGEAIKQGAVAILCDSQIELKNDNIVIIKHQSPRFILSKMAARLYKEQPKNIAAITGTNGKTSTVHFLRQIWHHLGFKAASIGTIGVYADEKKMDLAKGESLTTPDPVSLHRWISDLAKNGVTHLAMEASSHGLVQRRLDGVKVNYGAFLNITRDHLDYHGDMKSYQKAKMRLFKEVMHSKSSAVINSDIGQFEMLENICKKREINIMTFGKKSEDLKFISTKQNFDGQNLRFKYLGKEYLAKLNLYGKFQADNVLCAMGIALMSGADIKDLMVILPKLTSVPGRMECITNDNYAVFVDYSHTPDALMKALQEAKRVAKKKLAVVFGCGGDRDKGKRKLMGEVAAACADEIIVTDDNPRTEDATQIRKEVMEGCPEAIEIADRKKAIEHAIKNLAKGDVLLIAGKGHEDYQIIGDKKIHFDDREVAREFGSKL